MMVGVLLVDEDVEICPTVFLETFLPLLPTSHLKELATSTEEVKHNTEIQPLVVAGCCLLLSFSYNFTRK